MIHFKFAELLNVVFVCMMYGIAMPILFPIGCIYLINCYVCEKLQLAFIVPCPPQMGDTMVNQVIEIIKLAPILLILNGWWMIDNQQIFANKWTYIVKSFQPMPSGHRILQFRVSWSSPMLLIGVIGVLIYFLQSFFKDRLEQLGFSFQKN